MDRSGDKSWIESISVVQVYKNCFIEVFQLYVFARRNQNRRKLIVGHCQDSKQIIYKTGCSSERLEFLVTYILSLMKNELRTDNSQSSNRRRRSLLTSSKPAFEVDYCQCSIKECAIECSKMIKAAILKTAFSAKYLSFTFFYVASRNCLFGLTFWSKEIVVLSTYQQQRTKYRSLPNGKTPTALSLLTDKPWKFV